MANNNRVYSFFFEAFYLSIKDAVAAWVDESENEKTGDCHD